MPQYFSPFNVGIFIGVVTERQWEIFTRALGEPELLDAAYRTNNLRSQARERLIPLVAKMIAQHTQQGKTVDQTLDWAANELEGFMRS